MTGPSPKSLLSFSSNEAREAVETAILLLPEAQETVSIKNEFSLGFRNRYSLLWQRNVQLRSTQVVKNARKAFKERDLDKQRARFFHIQKVKGMIFSIQDISSFCQRLTCEGPRP
jgi:hypothetical protein